MSCFLMQLNILSFISDLLNVLSKLIGRSFSGKEVSPILWMPITFAFFPKVGKIILVNALVKISDKGLTRAGLEILQT